MDEAGDVDQDIDGADLTGIGVHGVGREHVQRIEPGARQTLELAAVQVGGVHDRALRDERLGDGAADALAGGRHHRDPVRQSACHLTSLPFRERERHVQDHPIGRNLFPFKIEAEL